MISDKKRAKKLLDLEVVIGLALTVVFFVMIGISAVLFENENYLFGTILIVVAILYFAVMALVMLRMEQLIGYYVCKECHHKYVPKYSTVLWGIHFGRTRYMKCPKCHKRSWQKKVV